MAWWEVEGLDLVKGWMNGLVIGRVTGWVSILTTDSTRVYMRDVCEWLGWRLSERLSKRKCGWVEILDGRWVR